MNSQKSWQTVQKSRFFERPLVAHLFTSSCRSTKVLRMSGKSSSVAAKKHVVPSKKVAVNAADKKTTYAENLSKKHCEVCTGECRACRVWYPPCRLLHTCGREDFGELKTLAAAALAHADTSRPCVIVPELDDHSRNLLIV